MGETRYSSDSIFRSFSYHFLWCMQMTRTRARSMIMKTAATDLAFMLCVFYAEPRISRVAISSGHSRAISRNPVHTLKAKSVDLRQNCAPAPSFYSRPSPRFYSCPSEKKVAFMNDGRPAFALASSGESRGNPAPIICCV